jgi:HAMP domain-containing protein
MEPELSAAADPANWWWVFDPRHSVRARAALIFGGGAVAFTLLLGWIAGTLLHRSIENQLGPAFENLAYQVGDKIDRAIYERYRAMRFAASLAPLRTATAPADERRRLLESLFDASPDNAWLGFADSAGTVVAATQRLREGDKVDTTAWFRGARNKAYAGGPHESPDLARELPNTGTEPPRFIDVAVPVTTAEGKFLGVLGAHLRWSSAWDTLTSVVSEPARRNRIGVTIYAATGEVLMDSGGSGWTEPPALSALPDARRLRGFFSEAVAGDSVYLTGFSRSRGYREFRGIGMIVVVRQPVAAAFAPVGELRHSIMQLGLWFAGAIAVLGWFFASRLTRRMAAIGIAARRIGGGDILTLMPHPRGRGELPQMCAALGDMVGKLRQAQEKLEADNTRLEARLRAPDRERKP